MGAPDRWKILIIDDEAGIRRVMTITLADAGYDVKTAADGAAGLERCRKDAPEIVITDIRMPGMDGIEVLEAVKSINPDIEVIVVTAFGEMDLAIRALQLDASDFITKPIHDDVLFVALERAKSRYRTRRQLKEYTAFLEDGWSETTRELMETFIFQRNLIESSMDGIMAVDHNGVVITFNRSMERMLGFSKPEVVHLLPLDRFFPPSTADALQAAMAGEKHGGSGRLSLYETTLLTKAADRIPVQVSATVIREDGRETGQVFFFRDLRKIRRLEREMADQARILHQDKMMSLGRLAASVVHEINNPLAGILNYLRLMIRMLQRGSIDADAQKKFSGYLEVVESETQRCSGIVSSLLTFSRKSRPSVGRVRIEELLDRCVILSKHKLQLSHIQLNVHVAADIPPVSGDMNQLQQCIINLIFNAIDAMGDGGELTIESRHDPAQRCVIVSVSDTGPGIADSDLPHIFEPFFTTKQEGYGVGLGLSTLYGIIEAHGGRVAVENRPGGGAAFHLTLPVSTP
jgi:PAS domain S-box-containing protein